MDRTRGASRAQKNPNGMGATLILKRNPRETGEVPVLGALVLGANNSLGGTPRLKENKTSRSRGALQARKNPSRMGATLLLKADNSPGGIPGLKNNKEDNSPGATLVLNKMRRDRNSLLTSTGSRWTSTASQ